MIASIIHIHKHPSYRHCNKPLHWRTLAVPYTTTPFKSLGSV